MQFNNQKLEIQVNNMPTVPGVYLYKNSRGKIIYIGKAKNLKNRVKSYFANKIEPGTKTYALVQNIESVDYIEALSELEALILEASLVKKHKPKYNVALKDDKSYLYIVIRNEKLTKNGKIVQIPKLIVARETDLEPKDVKFGPYPHGDVAKYIARTIRKIIPYRDCSPSKFNKYQKLGNPCLYGHIGLCSAPCTDNISLKKYKSDISRIKRLLGGESTQVLNDLEKAMQTASKNKEYELAAEYRDTLKKFNYARKSFSEAQKYIDNPYLVEDIINKSLDELVSNIPVLDSYPRRIECYDISNISGKEAVGSLVVATNGRIDKSQYRKFKIKLKETPDDFGMMQEVLSRRLKREISSSKNINKWGIPDLIVLDGGKGQVSAVEQVLKELKMDILLIGLAKRYETIVYRDSTTDEFIELNLSKDNEGLKLLQRLRDEAHRFAQQYHHKLRLQKISKD